jgi:hypothetical protein
MSLFLLRLIICQLFECFSSDTYVYPIYYNNMTEMTRDGVVARLCLQDRTKNQKCELFDSNSIYTLNRLW